MYSSLYGKKCAYFIKIRGNLANLRFVAYQGTSASEHRACQLFYPNSECAKPGYVPDYKPIGQNIKAVSLLTDYLRSFQIINNIPYYRYCRSTADVESFNNVITIYAPKRLHFQKTYEMRVCLVILHWNENARKPRQYPEGVADRNQDNSNRTRERARYWTKQSTYRFRHEIIDDVFGTI